MIHLPLFVGQLPRAVAAGLVDHRRRHDLRVAGFVSFGEEEVDEGALQACAVPDIDGEACAGNLHAKVKVNEVVFLREFPVRQFLAVCDTLGGDGFVGMGRPVFQCDGFAGCKAVEHGLIGPVAHAHSEVIFCAGAFRHNFVGHIGDGEQQVALCLLCLRHLFVEEGDLLFE